MTIREYSTLMGYEEICPLSEYKTADFIYMMAGDMSKQDFAKAYKEVRGNALVLALAESANSREIACRDKETKECRAAHALLLEANEIRERGMCDSADAIDHIASLLIGQKDCIKRKIAYGFALSDSDNEYITDNLC